MLPKVVLRCGLFVSRESEGTKSRREKTRDRCYDFENIFVKKFSIKLSFLTQNKAKLFKILIITLVIEENAIFFAENCKKSQKMWS
jgi:hypothetical protein